jgi:hypothetical protein
MATILGAIGSWITGTALPGVINFFVGGVSIVASAVGGWFGAVLLILFVISLITAAVIAYYKGFFNSVKDKYENVQLIDEKHIFEELNSHQGQSANLEAKLTFFEKDLNEEVNNLITEHNIEEDKASSMNMFINSIIDLINKAGKAGENICQRNFDLYGNSVTTLNFKYNKEEHKIILTFTFYDEKLFEYLTLLIEMINKRGYILEKNYEEQLKTFEIEKNDVNNFKIKIIDYNK